MTKLANLRLSDLKARVDEVGDCWLWRGAKGHGKDPRWSIGGKVFQARRVVFELAHEIAPGKRQVGVNCGNPVCVHPDHIVARTRSQAALNGTKSAAGIANMAAAARARKNKLSMEAAREIRASDEKSAELALKFGVSREMVCSIRRGQSWVESLGVFAGLGARA